MSFQELINIILCSIGAVCLIVCVAYTMNSVWTRLDGRRDADRKRLEQYDLTVPKCLQELDVLKRENQWLRDQLTQARRKLDTARRHPAFVIAEQNARRRRRCDRGEDTASSSEGGD